MTDEERQEVRLQFIKLVFVAGIIGLQLALLDQRFQIEAKAWAARWRQRIRAWQDGNTAGVKVAEWFVRDEAPKVVAEAERLTKEQS